MVELQFTNILITRGRETKPLSPPIATLEKKSIYLGRGNYSLKSKEVEIEKTTSELLGGGRTSSGGGYGRRVSDGHRGASTGGGRQSSTILTLSTPKLTAKCTLVNPSAETLRKFDEFLNAIEIGRAKTSGNNGRQTGYEERQTGGYDRRVTTGSGKKKAPTVTPARGIYMSPKKQRMHSPLRRITHTSHSHSQKEELRGNVVSSPTKATRMKLPPKSPRNATPNRFRSGNDDEEGAVFVRRERALSVGRFSQDSVEKADEKLDHGDSDEEVPRRNRLVKPSRRSSKEEEDSDVEFDESPTAKKKLRLSMEDVSSPENDKDVWMGIHEGIGEKETGESGRKAEVGTEMETEVPEVQSEKKVETDEPTKADHTKPKKTIHSFFTAKPKTKPAEPKADTFGGAILSSPKKSTRAPASTPPPSTKPTPVLRQKQTASRYFGKKNDEKIDYATEDEEIPEPEEEEEVIGGLDQYFHHEESEPRMNEVTIPKSRFTKSYGSRNPYSKTRPNVGRSRIVPRETSPAKRLDFSVFSAGSTADRALAQATSGRKLSPPPSVSRTPFISSTAPKDEESKPTTTPGIQNLGNTCYLSASLQTLFGIPDFLLDLYKMYDVECSKKAMPLTQCLLEVAVAIGVIPEDQMPKIDALAAKSKLLTSKVANPSALKKQMDVLTDKFVGYEQRDAHEFLSDLVDYLHEELVAEEKVVDDGSASDKENDRSEEERSRNDEETAENVAEDIMKQHVLPPTDDYFHLKVRVCLECDSCRYSRSKEELYRHLSLDVGDDIENDQWTVERGLAQFFQPEKRELKCEKCTSGTTATQTIEIISCPKALLLHFKRFIVTKEARATSKTSDDKDGASANSPVMEMVLKKNKARINLEESLSIPIFAHKAIYQLRGVVHHVGNTAFSGHYTSCGVRANALDTQDNEEHWVYFDDRVGVKKDLDYVTLNERNQRNCYMALYELR